MRKEDGKGRHKQRASTTWPATLNPFPEVAFVIFIFLFFQLPILFFFCYYFRLLFYLSVSVCLRVPPNLTNAAR